MEKKDIELNKFYTVSEVADTMLASRAKTFANRRGSILALIKRGRIKAEKRMVQISPRHEEGQWMIRGSDLLAYVENRYGRRNDSD